MSHLEFKALLIVFFDIQGLVMTEWVPSGQTVNQHYFIEVLTKLHERLRRKRPGLWRNGCVLHQDNAKIKSVLKGTHFVSVEEVKAKPMELLNSLTENDLNHCFEQWQHRMQLCSNS